VTGRAQLEPEDSTRASIVIEARAVSRAFSGKLALRDASLVARQGEIHALLGPNGAGKTTLLRMLSGLHQPTEGRVSMLGMDPARGRRELRRAVGLVPAGDRSFYLRLTGLENLVFFGRLHGLRRRAAVARAMNVLSEVGLADAARVRVGVYSHGMQKRLSIARALLTYPAVLLVDEATHDLDPEGARRVRDLVTARAHAGTTVIWATQRLEEIRGFADRVTVLDHGEIRFAGTVPELMARAAPRRYLVRLQDEGRDAERLQSDLDAALGHRARMRPASASESGHYLLWLTDGIVLGDVLAALTAARVQVVGLTEERSEIEEAFLFLTRAG